MGFFDKILGKKKPSEKVTIEGLNDSIGEIDCCPYCKEKLDPIPKRKKKCPHCGEFMYSRTRPADNQKILVTEKQKEEVEVQWSKVYEAQEEEQLMENPDFAKAKADLTKQFGKEPSFNDTKWRVYNENILKYASKRQWGLYRNNKLDMAYLLQKENKSKQALSTMFEVIYLDINGCSNMGIIYSKFDMEEDSDIKEFDPKQAFMAPGVIGPIQDLITELELSEKEAKELFLSINKKMKPSKKMPIPEDKAWEKLLKEININKANAQKVENLDTSNVDDVIKEIKSLMKSKNRDTLNSIVYKFRNEYKTKKMIIPNAAGIKKVIKTLLDQEEESNGLGVSILLFYIKKDNELFSDIAEEYLKANKKKFEKCPEEHTIGQLGQINPDWVKDLIPGMIKQLQRNSEWNTRRFIAFNLGAIGSKHSDLVKDAIPIMIEYIENPSKVTDRKPLEFEESGVKLSINMSPESMLGVDQTQWLKDAYIDALGMIGKGNPDLIIKYKSLFSKIAKKDKSEYSRKKAQTVLDLF
jgi:hypothetical protein